MPIRLWPKEAMTPRQSGPWDAVLPARMVSEIDAPAFETIVLTTIPPPSRAALPVTVLLVNVRTPRLSIPAA